VSPFVLSLYLFPRWVVTRHVKRWSHCHRHTAATPRRFLSNRMPCDALCISPDLTSLTPSSCDKQLTLDCCSLPRSNAAAPQSPYSPVKSSGGQSPFLQPVTMSDFGYAMLLAEGDASQRAPILCSKAIYMYYTADL